MKNTGKTVVTPGPNATLRQRKGTTPGGRLYSSTRITSDAGPAKHTEVKSSITKWKKTTGPGGSTKTRETGGNTHYGPSTNKVIGKGPTKVKAGYKSTHNFKDGGKVRSGTTPSGKKYKSVQWASGKKTTKVGGKIKETTPKNYLGMGNKRTVEKFSDKTTRYPNPY